MKSHHIEKTIGIVCNKDFEIFHIKAEAGIIIVIDWVGRGLLRSPHPMPLSWAGTPSARPACSI